MTSAAAPLLGLKSTFTAGVIAVLMLAQSASYAQKVTLLDGAGPNGVGAAALIETKATVIAVDAAAYSATLKGSGGRTFDVTVSPEVGDIGKMRVGDKVDIAYQESILVHLDKVKSNGIRERVDETAILPASGGVAASAHRVLVLATIEKLDPEKRLVTLRGPLRSGTIKAGPDIHFADLKVGDTVSAEFVTATAVRVTRDSLALN